MNTKFLAYIGTFGTMSFDMTLEAVDDSGLIEIDVVRLDGDFTLEDLENIINKMKVYI